MIKLLFALLVLMLFACEDDSSSANVSNSAEEQILDVSDIVYDSLEDSRDGQVYTTVRIGNQWWMAENLNYAVDSSFCYNDELDSCTIYGRLYPWIVAMNLDSVYSNVGAFYDGIVDSVHQGICPKGWHIPSEEEWKILIEYADAHNGEEGIGASMRAPYGWEEYVGNEYVDGEFRMDVVIEYTDRFGFAAIPGGARASTSFYCGNAFYAYFWSATEVFSYRNDMPKVVYFADNAMMNADGFYSVTKFTKSYALSVRCLKNE
jgi:uncharacterized protein (TIGR02145 family)